MAFALKCMVDAGLVGFVRFALMDIVNTVLLILYLIDLVVWIFSLDD